ncbi:Zn-dependent protease [Bacteriovorax stolpii]|uniref:Zn-dependent protease n=1 Tax=Bacteriovorax stolpii TaxID=960 RepID=A0A2K9NUR3_BACTC|nr:metallopeptidase TldD-related protein [Bacteriovorax stolpii]AUN99217.1 Zn-dependent protease [Bacteriovorax stolpii]TDP55244.1 putative Zn-dependent protease [Bacteriovorax stolpii]
MKALESSYLEIFAKQIFNDLKSDEALTLNFTGEETLFSRLSKAKVRQVTNLQQAFIDFVFVKGNKVLTFNMPFRANESDVTLALKKLNQSREWIAALPEDPYLVRPKFYGVTKEENLNQLPNNEEMMGQVLDIAGNVDLAGVFSSGDVVRATINSEGQFHWFKTRNFYLDYSLYNDKQKAVKSLYAGSDWDNTELKRNIKDAEHKLSLMNRDSKKVARGDYRVYLAPSAVNELLGTLSWGGVSMSAHQQGNGSLKDLWQAKKKMSPKFTLKEDYSLGLAPRFNDAGEVSPAELMLIEKGEFKNFLVSTRTANEYKLESNFASDWESMRSPVISTGDLSRDDIYKELGTGLYLSDLHYLNWSDRETARVTGMTRYACFWVENGEIASPIEDLRFDESYYSMFGDALERITNFSEISPSTGSYFQRDVGGTRTPGLLLSNFKFTL